MSLFSKTKEAEPERAPHPTVSGSAYAREEPKGYDTMDSVQADEFLKRITYKDATFSWKSWTNEVTMKIAVPNSDGKGGDVFFDIPSSPLNITQAELAWCAYLCVLWYEEHEAREELQLDGEPFLFPHDELGTPERDSDLVFATRRRFFDARFRNAEGQLIFQLEDAVRNTPLAFDLKT